MKKIPHSKDELRNFLSSLPKDPGIYQFYGKGSSPIYIGKAKNIKKRVSSYFRLLRDKSLKTSALMNEASFIDITVTKSELEALLIEQHKINVNKPKFNIQFKDDKGYPWIKIETSNQFPKAKSFLGRKSIKSKDKYFGPYPSSYAVKEVLNLIQKNFKLRNCSNSFFKNRTRPCMQYQIGRCSAPCVDYINQADYLKEVRSAELLLEGKSNELLNKLYSQMDAYSNSKSFEQAAEYRDKISALRNIQRKQSISGFQKERNAITALTFNGITKVGITHVKDGWITSHENFVLKSSVINSPVIETFIKRHYLSDIFCPKNLVIQQPLEEKSILENALSNFHNKKIKIITKPGKKDRGLLEICRSNTELAFKGSSKTGGDITTTLDALRKYLGLNHKIELIESYDISHHSSSGAVAGCVVYGNKGKLKDKYRAFNISSKNAGNDIGSTLEVIERRFRNKELDLEKPNMILIDGSKPHLNAVVGKLKDLQIEGIEVISVSKGVRRKVEFDSIHKKDQSTTRVIKGSLTHLFIQEIRDETHRFTISLQKKKQIKSSLNSSLDDMRGVGKKKKNILLRHFGSLEQIEKAGLEDFLSVPGIGKETASNLFKFLHQA